jgi:hypothetical protein
MLRLAATPLFLLLTGIASADPVYLCAIPGPFSFVGSMWFMYLAMAAVHMQPWIDLLRQHMPAGSQLEVAGRIVPATTRFERQNGPSTLR